MQTEFRTGRLVDGECKRPISAVIIFRRKSVEIGRVYFSPIGGCFTLGSKAFITDNKNGIEPKLREIVSSLD
jgi:hypothetical protein